MNNWMERNAAHVEGSHIYLEYDGPRRSVILRTPMSSYIQSMAVNVLLGWFHEISDDTLSVTCRGLKKRGKILSCYLQLRTTQYKSDTWIRCEPEKHWECEDP